MTSAEAQDRIAHAFLVERILTRLGWIVLGIGAVSLPGIAVLWLDASITLTTAMGAAAATLVGTVLAGAGAYGSGTKIGIAASRHRSSPSPRSASAQRPVPTPTAPTSALQTVSRGSRPRVRYPGGDCPASAPESTDTCPTRWSPTTAFGSATTSQTWDPPRSHHPSGPAQPSPGSTGANRARWPSAYSAAGGRVSGPALGSGK